MNKYIIANWKMNNTIADIDVFVDYLKNNAEGEENLVVCTPATMIYPFVKCANGIVETGAENCYFEKKGAFTGEISPLMVKDAGANFCIIGHSERRHIFGEENELLNKKLFSCLEEGLKVVFCIGETLEEKENYKEVLKKQIIEGFEGVSDFSNIILAYEPVWAIGTGKVATTNDIDEIHKFIKQLVKENFNTDIAVLYGGSVKPSNSKEILALESVDGVLIGGASLKAEDFVTIAKSRD